MFKRYLSIITIILTGIISASMNAANAEEAASSRDFYAEKAKRRDLRRSIYQMSDRVDALAASDETPGEVLVIGVKALSTGLDELQKRSTPSKFERRFGSMQRKVNMALVVNALADNSSRLPFGKRIVRSAQQSREVAAQYPLPQTPVPAHLQGTPLRKSNNRASKSMATVLSKSIPKVD